MGIIKPPGRIECGEIFYFKNGESIDLAKLDPKSREMRAIRGNDIAMIFQEPMTSLNPVFTVGEQIREAIVLHQNLSKKDARIKTLEMLERVGMPAPEQRVNEYPHQLSGGMRQRVMIAMALSCSPSLLIADEPTTALDVTIQAQMLELMKALQEQYKTAIMFITHDLGVIAQTADHIIVMYLGKIVESASARDIFQAPGHPYTKGLLNSIPSLISKKGDRLVPIGGVVPSQLNLPSGCSFEPRCRHATEICKKQRPLLKEIGPNHYISCWLYN
jgi:oligopeptide/dipeptide ABC transporter ATP-binding protein